MNFVILYRFLVDVKFINYFSTFLSTNHLNMVVIKPHIGILQFFSAENILTIMEIINNLNSIKLAECTFRIHQAYRKNKTYREIINMIQDYNRNATHEQRVEEEDYLFYCKEQITCAIDHDVDEIIIQAKNTKNLKELDNLLDTKTSFHSAVKNFRIWLENNEYIQE